MFRVTTNGTLRTYRGNLAKASWNQYYAMNTVLTGRRFNSFSEDPALAAQSFRVHAASARNEFQRKTSESAIHKFESAQASLQEIEISTIQRLTRPNKAWTAPNQAPVRRLGKPC